MSVIATRARGTTTLPGLLVSLLLIGGCDEVREEHPRTKAEAEKLVEGGVVPACLPNTTTDIRVVYDLDLNAAFGSFRLGDDGSGRLPCPNLNASEIERIDIFSFKKVAWWPRELDGALKTAVDEHGYSAYVDPIRSDQTIYDRFIIVVSGDRRSGYFWTNNTGSWKDIFDSSRNN